MSGFGRIPRERIKFDFLYLTVLNLIMADRPKEDREPNFVHGLPCRLYESTHYTEIAFQRGKNVKRSKTSNHGLLENMFS